MHRFANPTRFLRLSAAILPWSAAATAALLAAGLVLGLAASPPDYQQGEAVRIMYVHVPAAWMALFVYTTVAAASAVSLVWRHALADLIARAASPIGAAFTFVALVTGSLWGKPMWGTWWDWDPRLTSQLILLFLYLGVIGLNAAIEDRRAAARAAGFLAIIGVVLLPIIRYSVEWWNSLHQGATIRVFGESTMDGSMTWPLWVMVLATKAWFVGSLLQRARVDNLRREAGKDWAREAAGAGA